MRKERKTTTGLFAFHANRTSILAHTHSLSLSFSLLHMVTSRRCGYSGCLCLHIHANCFVVVSLPFRCRFVAVCCLLLSRRARRVSHADGYAHAHHRYPGNVRDSSKTRDGSRVRRIGAAKAIEREEQSKFGGKGSPRLWWQNGGEHTFGDTPTHFTTSRCLLLRRANVVMAPTRRPEPFTIHAQVATEGEQVYRDTLRKKTTKMSCCRGKTKMRIKKSKTRRYIVPISTRVKKKSVPPLVESICVN